MACGSIISSTLRHNVVIGAHTAIAASTAIAGKHAHWQPLLIGCGVVILGQLSIGDDIVIAGTGVVTRSLDTPGMYSSVFPVEEVRLWRRLVGRFGGSKRWWAGSVNWKP